MKLLVKVGGTLVDDPARRALVAASLAKLLSDGHLVAVVHGGGRQLTQFLQDRGVESRFVGGLRVTTPDTIDAVIKVLAGSVNKQLVAALRIAGVAAVGLSGIDGGIVTAVCASEELGLVGRVERADPALLNVLVGSGYLPVIACLGGDALGNIYNINADQMASACALAFAADALLFLTDVPGVLDTYGNVLPTLSLEQTRHLVSSGVARGGMQAKLEAASVAVQGGVKYVIITPGDCSGVFDHGTRVTA